MLSAGAWALLAASSLVIGAWLTATFNVPTRLVGEAMGFRRGSARDHGRSELIPAAA